MEVRRRRLHAAASTRASCSARRARGAWPQRRRCRERGPIGGARSTVAPWPSPGAVLAAGGRRVAFIDFWPGFYDNTDLWFTIDWFRRNLPGVEIVEENENPGVILFTLFGRSYLQHVRSGSSAKLVFFTGENTRPPLRRVPLCISFDRVPDVPATVHTRIPLWVFIREVHDVLRMHAARLRGEVDREVRQRKGFCSFVASNASMHNARVRISFVKALSARYKQVSCGGEVMNNIGGPVKDKMAFLRGCRFNVAFENASHPGYCTEKVLHAFAAGCVPIYWGDPELSSSGSGIADFNPAALISAHDFETPDDLIRHVEKVDKDPELLESYLRQPIFAERWYERLKDWPGFCRGLVELLFAEADKGTPALAPPPGAAPAGRPAGVAGPARS